MKYYAEILDNIIINLGTYDNELPEGMVDLHEQHYHTVFCGKTQYTELPEIVVEEPTPIPVEVVDDVNPLEDDPQDEIPPYEDIEADPTYEEILDSE
jgi:hypothetical protein